ncbi:MAG: hypothetical protein AAFQ19_07210 [Pseudomonadota bacterium]
MLSDAGAISHIAAAASSVPISRLCRWASTITCRASAFDSQVRVATAVSLRVTMGVST